MDYIVQAICTNGVAAVLLVSLMLNYARKHYDKKRENILFLVMLTINLLQCIIEAITIAIDGRAFAGDIWISTILNSLLFANNIIFALCWSMYADAKVGYDKKYGTKVKMLKAAPALLVVIGAIVNLFYPVFFRITDENVYVREFGFIFAYIVTYYYLVLGTVVVCMHRKNIEKYNFLPVFTFLLPVFGASVIQFFVQGISLLWAGAAIGLTSAYMSLLDESSLTDKLSGLYSRHHLNQYLATLSSRVKGNKNMYGIMLDIDDFKMINDTHGHLVGDDAITSAAKIIRTAINTEKTVFRFAGDEFVVILPLENERQAQRVVAKIHNLAEYFNLNAEKPYDLNFSIGYTPYIQGENPNDFIERMDLEMYKDKKQKKMQS